MKYDDKTLSAYIDGELPKRELAAIGADVKADPLLRARIARLKGADQTVRAAYADVIDEAPPERLLQSFKGLGAPRRPPSFLARATSYWPAALAASVALVIGYYGASQFQAGPQAFAVAKNDFRVLGVISDGHAMFESFETGQSAQIYDVAGQDALKVELVLSFKSVGGDFCREFLAYRSADAFHGVACKADESWTVRIAVKTPAEIDPSVGYETAATDLDTVISDYVARSMSGEALDLDQEKAVIAKGWK